MINQEDECIFMGFNQDQGCFAVGLKTGFKIFQTQPIKLLKDRLFEGGIQSISMLYHSNFLTLVGTGKNLEFPQNKLIIWDDNQQQVLGSIVFQTKIINQHLLPEQIITILHNKTFIHKFPTLEVTHAIATIDNPRGLFTINQTGQNTIYATLVSTKGHVQLYINEEQSFQNIIKAHQSQIGTIQLNNSGNKLATASEKGNVIRIFNSYSGYLVQQLRRGNEYATLYSISFENYGRMIAVSSDSKNVHVFMINLFEDEKKDLVLKNENVTEQYNKKSFLASIIDLDYFKMEQSYAKLVVQDIKKIVAFGVEMNQIIVVTDKGLYYQGQFDLKKGGYIKLISEPINFLKL